MATRHSIVLATVAWAASCSGRDAYAFDYGFLPLGGEAKTLAGAATATSEGAPALFSNPANLAKGKRMEAYGELSLLSLHYTYKYTGYDTAKLDLMTPVPLLGFAIPLGKRWSAGLSGLLVPGNSPSQKIHGVPSRALGEEPVLLDLEIGGGKAPSYLLALGLAFKLTPDLALGVSAAHYDVRGNLKISDHESETLVAELATRSQRTVPSLGAAWRVGPHLNLALAAEAEVKTQIDVESKNEGGEKRSRQGRRGGKQRLAGEASRWGVKPFVEIQREEHRRDFGDPLDLDPDARKIPSVHDTINEIVGVRLSTSKRSSVSLAYGWYPTAVADGIMADRTSSGTERSGVAFGNMDALSRNVYGVGFRFQPKFGRTGCGVSHHRGRRQVPESSRGYGYYQLDASYLSCDLGWQF